MIKTESCCDQVNKRNKVLQWIFFLLNRKVEDLQFRVEEACITKGDLEVSAANKHRKKLVVFSATIN